MGNANISQPAIKREPNVTDPDDACICFSDGKIKVIRNFNEKQHLHGESITYYENTNSIKYKSMHDDGIIQSESEFYDNDKNSIKEKKHYIDGMLVEIIKFNQYCDMTERFELDMSDKKSYVKTTYYESGKKRADIYYNNDDSVKREISYYDNNDNSKKHDSCTEDTGEYIVWYENNKIQFIDRHNKSTDLYETISFDQQGNLLHELVSKVINNEFVTMKTTDYYSTGNIKKIIGVDDTTNSVISLFFSESGVKLIEDRYFNGKLHGICSKWLNDGSIDIEMNYNNGIPDGIWKFHNLFPHVISLLEWKDGKIVTALNFPEKDNLFDKIPDYPDLEIV